MKWQILIILMMALPIAYSEICEDVIKPNTLCQMTTPSIYCTDYNYTIYNASGATIGNGNLTLLSAQIYYFNFTNSTGDYVVELCDGTTREIYVQQTEEAKSKMFMSIIIWMSLLIIGCIFGFAYSSNKLVKIVFGCLALAIVLLGTNTINLMAASNDLGNGVSAMTSSLYVFAMRVVYVLLTALFIYGIWRLFKYMTDGVKSWKGGHRGNRGNNNA